MAGFRQFGLMGLMVAVTGGLAYFLGSQAGQALNDRSANKLKESRSSMQYSLLTKMKNVEIGSRIEDYQFENLSGELQSLRSLVHGRTVIAFIEPDCPACMEEVGRIGALAEDSVCAQRFVFVSSGSPFQLMQVRQQLRIMSPLLYDHKDMFASRVKIATYPTNVIVDENLEIKEVIPGQLTDSEIETVCQRDLK
ncbi:MAG TPA: redoxin domain-containing protein [Candidatus Deferrimicrobium sp.]|nr:redoxin domain-containing protein [Candidatus Deferrimicrobium sp.]